MDEIKSPAQRGWSSAEQPGPPLAPSRQPAPGLIWFREKELLGEQKS